MVLWVGLQGAKVPLSQGVLKQAVGVADAARDGGLWFGGCTRDLAARMVGGGASEKVAAVASGPAGKTAGACVAACLLPAGSVELIGVGVGSTTAIARQRTAGSRRGRLCPQPSGSRRRHQAAIAALFQLTHAEPAHQPLSRASRAQRHEREATEVVTSQQPESAVVEEPASEPAPEPSNAPRAKRADGLGKLALRFGKIVDKETTPFDGSFFYVIGHAVCKKGERVISGGVRQNSGSATNIQHIWIVESGPVPSKRAWYVSMNSDLGGAARDDFKVVAVCARR